MTSIEQYHDPLDGNDYAPAWDRAMLDGLATRLSFGPGVFRFSRGVKYTRVCAVEGAGWFPNIYARVGDPPEAVGGTVLMFDGTSTGITIGRAADGVHGVDGSALRNLSVRCKAPLPDADGVYVGAGYVDIDHVTIYGWTRDGLHVRGDVATGDGGANCGSVTRVVSGVNGRHGFYWSGGDAGVWAGFGCSAVANGVDGFHDESFMGQYPWGSHTADNSRYGFFALAGNQRGVWSGYAESNQKSLLPGSNLSLNLRTVWDGVSAAVDAAFGVVRTGQISSQAQTSKVATQLGSTDPESAIDLVDASLAALRFVRRTAGGLSNMWAFAWKGANSLAPLGITTDGHALGAGQAVFPRAQVFFGSRTVLGFAEVPPATASAADVGGVWLAKAPTAALDGWRCKSVQGVPTWVPFVLGAVT